MIGAHLQFHFPGEGRGPVGEVVVKERCSHLAAFPNWTPASAGEVPQNPSAMLGVAPHSPIRHNRNMITFYLARASNGVIGRDGQLPWRIPADLKRFKTLTMGKPMVMGRKTFETFPSPLPGRRHIVLTRGDWSAEGAEVAHSVEGALAMAGDEVAVIGGAQIYAQLLPLADRIQLTEIHAEPEGDATVPAFEDWREIAREDYPAENGRPAYSFVTLMR